MKSALGKLDKPKGASRLPLGLIELVLLNLTLQAVGVGYSAALFRRGLFEPLQSIVSRLAFPVVVDLVALFLLGRLALFLTQIPEDSAADEKATAIDASIAAGAPWWLGYALALLLARAALVLANLPFSRSLFAPLEPLFAYLPVYRGVAELSRWHPLHWYVAIAFVLLSAFFGGLVARRSLVAAKRLHLGFRLTLLLVAIGSFSSAQRAYESWQPAVEGDQISSKLISTPRLGGEDWTPEGLYGRITLVEFWTTWCGACKRILPDLRTLKSKLSDANFEVLLVNVEGRGKPSPKLLKKIEEYQKERAPELSVLIDRGAWSDAVGITVYPTLVLIGPKGRMLRLWSGTPSMDDVQRSVVAALRLGL